MTAPVLQFRLSLPYARPPAGLTGNSRSHWRTKAACTKQLRADVLALARQAGLHRLGPCRHVTVALTWAPGDRRQRDEDNLWPFMKVACDALARGRADWVGLDLVPNDSPRFMTKRAPFIAPPPAKGMWLDVEVDLAQIAPGIALSSSRSASDVPVRPVTAADPDGAHSGAQGSTPTERTDQP